MNPRKALRKKRMRRQRRTKPHLFGSASRPRLAVFRSNRCMYAQLIDDGKGQTLASASSREAGNVGVKQSKTDTAQRIGELIAERARALGITEAAFDRRSYRYHGRVKAVAEGARKGGLKI